MSQPMDVLPLWALFGITIVIALLSIEAGYRLGLYRGRRSEEEREGPVGAIVAATLGLLGFVLAFTFGLAASRFDTRNRIVVDEANAVGTTFLRAGLLPEGRGRKIRELLREYVDARLEAVETGDVDKVLRRSDDLHREMWKEAEAVGKEQPNSIVVGLFIQSLNETIDVHSRRVFVVVHGRIPRILWTALYIVTVLTMAGVGYHGGLTKSKRSLAIGVLVLTFSAVMIMVVDLDRPQEGFFKVSQQAMVDVRDMMKHTF